MEEFNYYKLIYKHACFRDCIEKYKYKYWLTTCVCHAINQMGHAGKFSKKRMNANRSSFNF